MAEILTIENARIGERIQCSDTASSDVIVRDKGTTWLIVQQPDSPGADEYLGPITAVLPEDCSRTTGGLPSDLVTQVREALSSDSNDVEHDALVAVARHFNINIPQTQVGSVLDFSPGSEYVGSVRGKAFRLTGTWEVVAIEPDDNFIIEPRTNALVNGRPAPADFYCYYDAEGSHA